MDPELLLWIVDGIMLLIAVEAAYLYHRFKRGLGTAPIHWLPSLISGVFLLLALRAAAVQADLIVVLPILLAAGLAHLVQFWTVR